MLPESFIGMDGDLGIEEQNLKIKTSLRDEQKDHRKTLAY